MSRTPHGYQKRGIGFMINNGAAGLFLDPGLGKTFMSYAAYLILKQKHIVNKMLVIAPLRPCYSVWPSEIKLWDELRHLKVAVLHGPKKEEALRSKADVYVINPEGLDWYFSSPARPQCEMLVVDESTKFKHHDTERFKTLKDHLPSFKRRYILTGTPAPNGLIDLFGQIYILDLGNALGRFITHYRRAFFENPQTGNPFDKYKWILQKGGEQRIYDKIKHMVIRMEAKDYLELPPLIENVVPLELPDKVRKQYTTMENHLVAMLKDEKVAVAASAAAAWNKCRQIANGGIFYEDGEKWEHLHEAKVDAVEEIIEELQGKPALVAYEYRHDLERLQKRFGKDIPHIGGGVPAKRFREIETAWNAGEIPILLAQPQSVAHGLNLQGTAAAVIFHSLTPDLEVDEQFVRRVWRQGQKARVVLHRIMMKDTVDEAIVALLRSKDRTQGALLRALKLYTNRKEAA
jgi:SNF2 family DNA or RNA helicase